MQGITKILLWALPAAVALSSCSGLSRIRVEEVRNVSVQPIGGGKMLVNMDVKVGNPSRRTVQLTMLELNVELGGALFATISAVKTIAVPPHNDAFLPVELELRLRNIISTMIMLQQRQISPEEMMVEGELRAKTFPLTKTVKIEKQSLSAFAAQYGDLLTPLLELQGK